MIRLLPLALTALLSGCVSAVPIQTHDVRPPIRVSAPTKTIGLNPMVANIIPTRKVGGGAGHADRFDREMIATGYRTVHIIPFFQRSGTAGNRQADLSPESGDTDASTR